MTQGEFIDYLHDNDCELNQDSTGLFFKCKRRNYKRQHSQVQVLLPIINLEEDVIEYLVCHACYHLEVNIPSELIDCCNDFKDYE